MEKLRIERLRTELLGDMNRANQPFMIVGRIVPALQDGEWTYAEELFARPYPKTYPDDDVDYADYIDSPDRIALLAYSGAECVGQIVLRRDWNRYAFIEDICVAQRARGHGVGTALIAGAREWAMGKGLMGLALETQDNNLLACRFYAKCGFRIGAVNTMLYRNFDRPYCDETAVFWYMRF